jgi:hypothetical protein
MDDAAAVERRPTLSHHHGQRESITFGMLATMAAAGIADERHRIADEDGQGRTTTTTGEMQSTWEEALARSGMP